MSIHLKKRVFVTIKLCFAALIGVIFAIAIQGKIDITNAPYGMDIILSTVGAALCAMVWRTMSEADSMIALCKGLSRRTTWDISDIVSYTKIKGRWTLYLVASVIISFVIGKAFPGYLPISKESYFMIQGGLLGVLILLLFQFMDHYFSLSERKKEIGINLADKERREKLSGKID